MNPNTLDHWNNLWPQNLFVHTRDPFCISRFKFVAGLCEPGTTILDVCSGPGHIRSYLPAGVVYERLDFCEVALKTYPGVYHVQNIMKDDPLPSPYHTILVMEILEHLDDPKSLILRCIASALRQVIFTVPNNRLPPEICPEHVRVWDRNSFSSYMGSVCSGFRLIFHTTEANIICQLMI